MVPDLYTQLGLKTTLAASGIGFALAFTALQLYWSWLIIKQVLKAMRGTPDAPQADRITSDAPQHEAQVLV